MELGPDTDFAVLDTHPFGDVISALKEHHSVLENYIKYAYKNGFDLLGYLKTDSNITLINCMEEPLIDLISEYLERGIDIENLIQIGLTVQRHNVFIFAPAIITHGDDSLIGRLFKYDIEQCHESGDYLNDLYVLRQYVVEVYTKAHHRLEKVMQTISEVADVEDLFLQYLDEGEDPHCTYTRAIVPYLDLKKLRRIADTDYDEHIGEILDEILHCDV